MNRHLISLTLATLLVGCSDPEPEIETSTIVAPVEESLTDVPAAAMLNFEAPARAFSRLAEQQSAAMLNLCTSMQGDIQSFLNEPSDETLQKAQTGFRDCYGRWTANRLFYQLAFSLSGREQYNKLMDLIDTRPFQAGYIGGLPEYPYSGLVHELDIPLTASNLRSQHRLMDEESASVGFPVIEFFLWKTPVDTFWTAQSENADTKLIQRRQDYLNEATQMLLANLTEITARWQADSAFTQLPERAQLAYILRSAQRLLMVELLGEHLEESALNEPEWHHPAQISGQGRRYILNKLDTLIRYLNPEENPEFGQWLDEQAADGLSSTQLLETLNQARSAIAQLPENYPFETNSDNAAWAESRRTIARLAVSFSQLSDTFQVSIVTE